MTEWLLRTGGEPRKITEGDDVVIEPSGNDLYVHRAGPAGEGIYHLATDRRQAEKLDLSSNYALSPIHLSRTAVGRAGEILLSVGRPDVFFFRAAIFDTVHKTLTMVPVPFPGIVASPGWTVDGKIVAMGVRWSGSLWRYRIAPGNKGRG